MSKEPDVFIRFIEVGADDPDRLLASQITDFLGGISIKRAVAIYSMAIQISFRDFKPSDQRLVLRTIAEACLRSWDANEEKSV